VPQQRGYSDRLLPNRRIEGLLAEAVLNPEIRHKPKGPAARPVILALPPALLVMCHSDFVRRSFQYSSFAIRHSTFVFLRHSLPSTHQILRPIDKLRVNRLRASITRGLPTSPRGPCEKNTALYRRAQNGVFGRQNNRAPGHLAAGTRDIKLKIPPNYFYSRIRRISSIM